MTSKTVYIICMCAASALALATGADGRALEKKQEGLRSQVEGLGASMARVEQSLATTEERVGRLGALEAQAARTREEAAALAKAHAEALRCGE